MDQRLHPSEPRPEWRPTNQLVEGIKAPFVRLFNPINRATVSCMAAARLQRTTDLSLLVVREFVKIGNFKSRLGLSCLL